MIDPNDFPALGSHNQHNSSYIAQNQGGQSSANASHQNSQLQQQQHLYMQQQQQQQQQQLGVTPAPPPGISGPTASAPSQSNGGLTEEFPALGASSESKDGRVSVQWMTMMDLTNKLWIDGQLFSESV